jgi:hypothetical protein
VGAPRVSPALGREPTDVTPLALLPIVASVPNVPVVAPVGVDPVVPERLGEEPVDPFVEGADGEESAPVGRESMPGRSGPAAVAAVAGRELSGGAGAAGCGVAPAILPHTVQ